MVPFKWRYILIGWVFLLLIIIFVLLKGKDGERGEQLEIVSLGDIVQRIDNFNLTRFKGENVEWGIGAENAVMHGREEDALLTDIIITHNQPDESQVRLTADRGRYNIGTNAFFIEKVERDVEVKIGQDITINVDSLVWFEEDRKVRSSGKVYVNGQRFTLEGEGLTANLDGGIYEINRNVRATGEEASVTRFISQEQGGTLSITSKKMTLKNQENTILFEGDVVVERDSMTLKAEKVEVVFISLERQGLVEGAEKKKELSTITATENVEFIQGARTILSDKVVYYKKDEKMIFTGSPTIKEERDELKGEKITVYIREDKVVVEGGEAIIHPR